MSIRQITQAISRTLRDGSRAVLATLIASASASDSISVGDKVLVHESGDFSGSLGVPQLDEAVARQATTFLQARDETKALRVREFAPELAQFAETIVLFERLESEPRLVIAGAGHVGASLARLAAMIGYRVTLIDDRAEFVDRSLFATSQETIDLMAAKDWQAAMRQAIGNGRGVSVAIVTRGHKQDEDCLRATIEASPDYVGMIGSKRRTNIVLDKLREEGANDVQLKKVRAPIGLDIGAVSPEEVALAILAEIVAERRGGGGAPLSKWRRD
jgi:xanthine dehydrogenase accessory factor